MNGAVKGKVEKKTSVLTYPEDIAKTLCPLEQKLLEFIDKRTDAKYVECHVQGGKIVEFGTIDVPLDPTEQANYRANREMLVNATAFKKMIDDAAEGRSFSDIVCEFSREIEPEKPLKVIGGQHRFEAIKRALKDGVDELHGIKIYYSLSKTQRLDVQLISNTNIAVSPDLYDRMKETHRGPELRKWCQETGLLPEGKDFTDKRVRGGPISVQIAKTFILNFFRGQVIKSGDFDSLDTTPVVAKKGQDDPEWEAFLDSHPNYIDNLKLKTAAEEFVGLANAQRAYFAESKTKVDFVEKAINLPLLSAWAYVAGVLQSNEVRLERHYSLKDSPKGDPLNAQALADGRHKSDKSNYRGLGVRTDAKECGRFAELFFSQAEYGTGIDKKRVDVAIKKYHAKQAVLDAKKAEG